MLVHLLMHIICKYETIFFLNININDLSFFFFKWGGGIWTLVASIGNTRRFQLNYKALGYDISYGQVNLYKQVSWENY